MAAAPVSGAPATRTFLKTGKSLSSWGSKSPINQTISALTGRIYARIHCKHFTKQMEQVGNSAPFVWCVYLHICVLVHVCVCVLTIHVQPLHDDGELYFTGHVTQGAHGHAQLLFGDETIPITIQDPERFTDLCTTNTHHQQPLSIACIIAKNIVYLLCGHFSTRECIVVVSLVQDFKVWRWAGGI